MPTLEENLLESINQHVASRELWQQQSTLHEQKRAQLEQSIADYLIVARSEYPILRLSKNQYLSGDSGSPPTHWGAHPNCTFEKICTVYGAAQLANRHPESILLLETIKLPSPNGYIGKPFNIWRMRWTAETPYTMYQEVHMSNAITGCFAYTRLESGSISDHWARGAGPEWALTGQFYGGGDAGSWANCHPYPGSGAGSILFALPAVVIGKRSADDKIWGLYPYLGDAMYD